LTAGNIGGEGKGEGEVAEVGTAKEEEWRVFNFFLLTWTWEFIQQRRRRRRKNIGLFEE